MRVLTALLTVLLVAVASSQDETSADQAIFTSGTDEPEIITDEPEIITDEPEIITDEPEITSDEPEIITDNSTSSYYEPQTYTFNGLSSNETVYLDADQSYYTIIDVSSSTPDNSTYPNNHEWQIQLVTFETPYWLSVQLERLDLEYNTQCYYDWLRIKDAKFCGRGSYTNYFEYVVPAYQTFTIKFHSDSSFTASGFQFKIYASGTSNDTTSFEPYGIISNPALTLSYKDVSQSDYVDSCKIDAPIPLPTTTDTYYTTEEPEVTNIECSNGDTERYFFLNDDSYSGFYDSNSNQRYVLTTQNFPTGNYGNNTSCKVKFYTGSSNQRLTAYFSWFDVESVSNCAFDSLCIGGLKLCSTWPTGKSFYYEIGAYNSFTLDFESDYSVAKSGFQIDLTFSASYASYGSNEATGGDGSDESTVEYSYVYPYNYQDRCAASYSPTPNEYYPELSSRRPWTDTDGSIYKNSFIEVAKQQLSEAEDNINVVEDLLNGLDNTQNPQYPQYARYENSLY